MFSMVTVASSTRMPTASASPPRVMMLSVWPSADKQRDREQDRQRDRDHDDQGRAPAAQEQKDHQAGQRGGDGAFPHHAGDGGAHEDGLVGQRRDLAAIGGKVCFSRGSSALTSSTMSSVEAAPLFRMVISTPRRPSMRTILRLRRRAVAHMRHIAHIDGGAVDLLDRQVVQFVDDAGAVVELHIIFELSRP